MDEGATWSLEIDKSFSELNHEYIIWHKGLTFCERNITRKTEEDKKYWWHHLADNLSTQESQLCHLVYKSTLLRYSTNQTTSTNTTSLDITQHESPPKSSPRAQCRALYQDEKDQCRDSRSLRKKKKNIWKCISQSSCATNFFSTQAQHNQLNFSFSLQMTVHLSIHIIFLQSDKNKNASFITTTLE